MVDTFSTLNATSLAASISPESSPADMLDAQLDYLQSRQDGAIFDFLKCESRYYVTTAIPGQISALCAVH